MAQNESTADRIRADIDYGCALLDTGREDEPMRRLIVLLMKCENYNNVARSLRKYSVKQLNSIELIESCMRLDVSPQNYNGYYFTSKAFFYSHDDRLILQELISSTDTQVCSQRR